MGAFTEIVLSAFEPFVDHRQGLFRTEMIVLKMFLKCFIIAKITLMYN